MLGCFTLKDKKEMLFSTTSLKSLKKLTSSALKRSILEIAANHQNFNERQKWSYLINKTTLEQILSALTFFTSRQFILIQNY